MKEHVLTLVHSWEKYVERKFYKYMTYPSPEPAVAVGVSGRVSGGGAGRITSGRVQRRVVESLESAHHGCGAGLGWKYGVRNYL